MFDWVLNMLLIMQGKPIEWFLVAANFHRKFFPHRLLKSEFLKFQEVHKIYSNFAHTKSTINMTKSVPVRTIQTKIILSKNL